MFGQNKVVTPKRFLEEPEDTLVVTSVFPTLQGEGPFAGHTAVFVRLAYCNLQCTFCFGLLPGRRIPKITMAEGTKKQLQTIAIGDKLLTFDENGNLSETTVTQTHNRHVDRWLRLRIEGREYFVTEEHPFYTTRGLLPAASLVTGDMILHSSGSEATPKNGMKVENIKLFDRNTYPPSTRPKPLQVFNLTCHPHNSYLIDNMWVHNCDTYFDDGERVSFADLESLIDIAAQKFPSRREPIVVFTGGEPLMQHNLLPFTEQYTIRRLIQIETNGNFYLPFQNRVCIVISPKVNEKTHQYIKVNEDLLERAHSLKFVVSHRIPGYRGVPDWAIEWRDSGINREIYVSPMNMYNEQPSMPTSRADMKERSEKERISFWQEGLLNKKENQRNHEYAAWVAMRYGCILTLQQHLYANLP